jgi:hypothetical protein
MALPKAYQIRKVNPEWIYYWRLAHNQHKEIIFTATLITPDPYCDAPLL